MQKPKISENTILELLGGTKKVAELCGTSLPAVSQLRKSGIPRSQLVFLAATLEKESHGLVTRQDLFPTNFWLIWPELLKNNTFGQQEEL
jgi:DNA-binding transcriptional regulator YdaS (Cro superfamily)